MTKNQMKELAALGAKAKIEALEAQIAAIKRDFPEAAKGKPGRPPMSAEQRARQSAAMKARWAANRFAKENGELAVVESLPPRKKGKKVA